MMEGSKERRRSSGIKESVDPDTVTEDAVLLVILMMLMVRVSVGKVIVWLGKTFEVC